MAGSGGAGVTAIGALIGVLVVLVPRIFDRLTGGRHERTDDAGTLSSSAGVLTDAAMKLVEQYQEDAAAFRESERRCHLDREADAARARAAEEQCRRDLDELRREVEELRSFHLGDLGS